MVLRIERQSPLLGGFFVYKVWKNCFDLVYNRYFSWAETSQLKGGNVPTIYNVLHRVHIDCRNGIRRDVENQLDIYKRFV